MNASILLMKKLSNVVLDAKAINKTLVLDVQEQWKTIVDLKVTLMSSNATENQMDDQLGQCEEQMYVKAKRGCRGYLEMGDSKYAGLLYEVKK